MRSSPDSTTLPAIPSRDAGSAPSTQDRLLEVLSRQGPTHRAELARLLDVSRTTVSTLVNALLEDGLLLVLEDESSQTGAAATSRLKRKLGLNPHRALFVTIVFRHEHVEVALGAADGRLLAVRGETTPTDTSGTERLERAREILRTLLGEHDLPVDAVQGCYVAQNTQVDEHSGEVLSEEASHIWFGTNAKRTVSTWVGGATVLVDNTARLTAYAEFLATPPPRPRCLVYVDLTWGVGLGMVEDGVLFTGGHGGAGEFGHTSLDHRGEPCGCGNRGCLQNAVGVPAVMTRAREALGPNTAGIAEIGRRAEGDDLGARTLVREIGEDLGAGLVTVCNLLDPDLIVLGGETTQLGPGLLDAAERVVRRRALALSTRTLTLRRALHVEQPHADSRAALQVLRSRVRIGER